MTDVWSPLLFITSTLLSFPVSKWRWEHLVLSLTWAVNVKVQIRLHCNSLSVCFCYQTTGVNLVNQYKAKHWPRCVYTFYHFQSEHLCLTRTWPYCDTNLMCFGAVLSCCQEKLCKKCMVYNFNSYHAQTVGLSAQCIYVWVCLRTAWELHGAHISASQKFCRIYPSGRKINHLIITTST